MASEQQIRRRENTTNERQAQEAEQGRVPTVITRLDAIAVQVKDSPLQSRAGSGSANTIGDVGGVGKARDTHEKANASASTESRSKDQSHHYEQISTGTGHKNIGDIGGAGEVRETHDQRKESSPFISLADRMKNEEDRREKGGQKDISYPGSVRRANVAEQNKEDGAKDQGGQERYQRSAHERGPYSVGKFEMKTEQNKGTSDWDKSAQSEAQNMNRAANEQGKNRKEGTHKEESKRSQETSNQQSHQQHSGGSEQPQQHGRGNEQQYTLEEISKYRGIAQQNSMEQLRAMEERYNQAKEAAKKGMGNATNYASEKTSQAKDTLVQGAQYASETAKEKTQQAGSAAKDTVASAAKTAVEYTAPIAERTKEGVVSAGKTAAEYTGKVAGEVKDRAPAAGWTAAHFTTEKAVEGTKLVASTVKDAAGYAGHLAAEIASKSIDVAKDVGASTGETAKDYTARKMEEARREYEAKKSTTQPQGTESHEQPGEETEGLISEKQEMGTERMMKTRTDQNKLSEQNRSPQQGGQRKDEWEGGNGQFHKTNVGNVEVTRVRPSHVQRGGDNKEESQDQFRQRKEENVETNKAARPSENISTKIKEGTEWADVKGSEVLSAIGETIVEIAQTTKDLVIGEDDDQRMENVGKDTTK